MNPKFFQDKHVNDSPVQYSFPAARTRQVPLAGNFNNWDPECLPVGKTKNGIWHLKVTLKPGRHQYRFSADGKWQDHPAAQQGTANTLGGANGARIVADVPARHNLVP